MATTILPAGEILEILSTTPAALAEATAGVDPGMLETRPGPDDWSALEVLAHLRSCADMWGGEIETILAEDHPTIRAINPRTWIDETDYREQRFRASMRAYAKQRDRLLAILESLPTKAWERAATVTGAGPKLELTVQRYASRMALHERPHRKQIERIVVAANA